MVHKYVHCLLLVSCGNQLYSTVTSYDSLKSFTNCEEKIYSVHVQLYRYSTYHRYRCRYRWRYRCRYRDRYRYRCRPRAGTGTGTGTGAGTAAGPGTGAGTGTGPVLAPVLRQNVFVDDIL